MESIEQVQCRFENEWVFGGLVLELPGVGGTRSINRVWGNKGVILGVAGVDLICILGRTRFIFLRDTSRG